MKKIKKLISIMFSIIITMNLIFSIVVDKSYANNNTKTMIVTIEEGSVDQSNLSKIINIPYLKEIVSVSVDTGTVTHSINGDKVTLNANSGNPTRVVDNPHKYSKTATDYNTSSSNSFSSTKSYNSGGYSGTLNKSGSSYVSSGSYTPSDTKFVTNQSSASYNSGGYSGTLTQYVHSGSYTAAQNKTVTSKVGPQTSTSFSSTKSYNSGGYSGTLSKSGSYYQDGSTTDSKTATDYSTSSSNSFSSTKSYSSGGYSGTLSKSGNSYVSSGSYTPSDTKFVTNQPSANYNSGGYSGTLTKYVHSGSYTPVDSKSVSIDLGYVQKNIYNDERYYSYSYSVDGYSGILDVIWKNISWDIEYETFTYRGTASGTVTKPASDTRVYRYEGNVTKPASDTRVWQQNYSGTVYKTISLYSQDYSGTVTKPASDTRVYRYEGNVTKPASDTRVYQQDYSGTVYKAGEDNYYQYNVTVEYVDNFEPELEITTNTDTIYINNDNDFTLSGIITDIDENQTVTVSATIDEITKSQTFITPINKEVWSFTWSGSELSDKSYNNIEVIAVDNEGGSTNKVYIGTLIVYKTPPVITIGEYETNPTNQDITVTASVDKGILNKDSHTFTENGSFEFVATDEAGNTSSKIVTIINIDKVAPVITIDEYNTNPTNQDITVTASVDKGTLNKDSHTFTENGSFEFVATDEAGNTSSKIVTIINIDKVAPVITIGEYETNPTNQDITITASVDKGTLNKDSHTFTENGSFEFVATDEAGNTSSKIVTIINIDKVAPVITIDEYNTNPTNQDITVTASVDKGTLNKDSHTFTENGSFEFVAIDEAGNTSSKIVTITNIDKIKPTEPNIIRDEENHKLILTPGIDNESGVDKSVYSINNSEWINFNGNIDISKFEDGNYNIIFKTFDKASNENEISFNFTIEYRAIIEELNNQIDSIIIDEDINLKELQDIFSNIQEEIDKLPNSDDKDNLQNKLDEIKNQANEEENKRIEKSNNIIDENIDINDNVDLDRLEEIIGIIQEEIDKLPDCNTKNNLQDQLNKLKEKARKENNKRLKEAIKAVELAKATRREPYIQRAKDNVSKLVASLEKTELEEIISAIEYIDQDSIDIKNAELKVSLAEATKREPYIQEAKDKVTSLKDSESKNNLKERLFNLEELLRINNDRIAVKNAEALVELAEKLRKEPYIIRAEEAIENLIFSNDKNKLTLRLQTLKNLLKNKKS